MTYENFTAPDGCTGRQLRTRWSIWTDQEVTRNLERALINSGLYTEPAIATIVELAQHLDDLIAETGDPTAGIDAFLGTDADTTERRNRWATLRIAEKQHRLPGRALLRPAAHLVSDDGPRRLLTPVEAGLVRRCGFASAAKTAIIGGFDSLLASGELPTLFARDVALDAAGTATIIHARGTEHDTPCGYPVALPRDCTIAPWARAAFTKLVSHSLPEQPLVYGGASQDHATIQSAILMNVNKVFIDAGIAADPTVKPLSIRNTAAHIFWQQAGIEATASALGHWDLTATAQEIGAMPRRRPQPTVRS